MNRGKQFESVIKDAFEKVPNVSVIRLHDQTTGYLGSSNISDFIIYKKPYQYFIECKSIHGNTFPFSNITKNQFEGMITMSRIEGVIAGIIVWWVDKDVTLFIPINTIRIWKEQTTMKSIPYNIYEKDLDIIKLQGKKKRVFFDYDMKEFLDKTFDIKYSL